MQAKEMNELELYFTIDACGGFIWRMNHDMGHGWIPKEDWSAIDKDIVKMQELQKEAVNELSRVGVAVPLDAEGRPTPEYWTWYRAWDAWKKNLSEEKWQEVNAASARGLTLEEVARYKLEAFGIW